MGSTIGHELTHGFDDEGRQFDKDGNLRNWWSKEDEEKFNQRAACMVKQYDAIEAVPGVHLNGKLTLGENLADLGGLWLAWLSWLDKAGAAHLSMTAATDGYTPGQRFWIAYAQQWCTQTRPSNCGPRRNPTRTRPTNTAPTPSCRICRSLLAVSVARRRRRWSAPSPAGYGNHLRWG